MLANDALHIAVLAGDGIGREVMAPALEVLRTVAATTPGLTFRFSEAPAGQAAEWIERAVDAAYAGALRPCEFGGSDGTRAVAAAVLSELNSGARS